MCSCEDQGVEDEEEGVCSVACWERRRSRCVEGSRGEARETRDFRQDRLEEIENLTVRVSQITVL